jgi:hypothetical protein
MKLSFRLESCFSLAPPNDASATFAEFRRRLIEPALKVSRSHCFFVRSSDRAKNAERFTIFHILQTTIYSGFFMIFHCAVCFIGPLAAEAER